MAWRPRNNRRDRIRAGLVFVAVCVAALGLTSPASSLDRPATYDQFVEATAQYVAATPSAPAGCRLDPATIQLIETGTGQPGYIYFPTCFDPNGNVVSYYVENTLMIDRTTSLYLHGADANVTLLEPLDPQQPLFEVVNAPLVNIASLHLRGRWDQMPGGDFRPYDNQVLLDISGGSSDLTFELQESFIEAGTIRIARRGSYRIQASTFDGGQVVPASIELDHADADLILVGGNMSSLWKGLNPSDAGVAPYPFCNGGYCEAHHIWQKHGRLQVYGVGVQASLGRSDFRIETPAGEPHVIVGVRSEGLHCVEPAYEDWQTGDPEPAVGIVSVPGLPGLPAQPVDILFANNQAAFISECPDGEETSHKNGQGHYIDYNGSGTVWSIANNAGVGVGRMVQGSAPGAKIVSLGNQFFGNTEITCSGSDCTVDDARNGVDVTGASTVGSGNIWRCGQFRAWAEAPQRNYACPDCDNHCPDTPYYELADSQFVNVGVNSIPATAVPQIPEMEIPLPLTRPVAASARFDMIDAADCRTDCTPLVCPGAPCPAVYPASCPPPAGAKYSDRCTLQAAINLATYFKRPLFIPRLGQGPGGAWDLDEPLYFLHGDQDPAVIPDPNSRIAAGWIVGKDNAVTIQTDSAESVLATEGMAQAIIQGITFKAEGPASTTATTVKIDQVGEVGRFQREATFHDCHFVGGRRALGIGLFSEQGCDTNIIINGSFRDAIYGLAIGSANALNNIAYGVTFDNNRVAMGHEAEPTLEKFQDPPPAADDIDPENPLRRSGSWFVYHGTVTNTKVKDIEYEGGEQVGLFHQFYTGSNNVINEEWWDGSGQLIAPMFDHSTLSSSSSMPSIRWQHAMGPTFLHSTVFGGRIDLTDWQTGAKRVLKLMSNITQWSSACLKDLPWAACGNGSGKLLELEYQVCDDDSDCDAGEVCVMEFGASEGYCL